MSTCSLGNWSPTPHCLARLRCDSIPYKDFEPFPNTGDADLLGGDSFTCLLTKVDRMDQPTVHPGQEPNNQEPNNQEPNTKPYQYPARIAVILALAAVVLRVSVILWRRGHDPLFHHPINDAAIYDQWARALLNGQGFGLEGAPYFLPPLFPLLTALLFRLDGGSLWAVTIVQALFGVITVLGIHRLGARLHGNRAGFLAGVLALFFAPAIWYEGWLLPTALNLFMLVVILNLLVECLDPNILNRSRSMTIFLGLGLMLGLAAVNRPQNLLLATLILAWLWWRSRAAGSVSYRSLGLVLAGVVVMIAPVTVRNWTVSGEPIAVSANGGVNFYVGNFSQANGRFSFPPGFPTYIGQMQATSREMAQTESGRTLTWRQTSAHWFGRGWGDLVGDPGQAIRLGLRKVHLLLAWREMENNFVVSWVREKSGPGRWLIPSMGFFWLLALPAVVQAVRRRGERDIALLIPMATVIFVCLAFWVSTRNRLPLMIPLAVFAGITLNSPRLWKSILNLALVALLAVAVFWPTGDREGAAFLCDVGRIHAQQGQLDQARWNFRESLLIEPDYPMALNGMALTYMDEGKPDQAIAMLREIIRIHPDFELARQNLKAILDYQNKKK
jgi:4-amino-4-deoxy-L-arabinose transferase-like glycosyltransferase